MPRKMQFFNTRKHEFIRLQETILSKLRHNRSKNMLQFYDIIHLKKKSEKIQNSKELVSLGNLTTTQMFVIMPKNFNNISKYYLHIWWRQTRSKSFKFDNKADLEKMISNINFLVALLLRALCFQGQLCYWESNH